MSETQELFENFCSQQKGNHLIIKELSDADDAKQGFLKKKQKTALMFCGLIVRRFLKGMSALSAASAVLIWSQCW